MPALGWVSPNRKSHKLNVPIDEDLKLRLEAMAVKRGIKKTELAREIIDASLKTMEQA